MVEHVHHVNTALQRGGAVRAGTLHGMELEAVRKDDPHGPVLTRANPSPESNPPHGGTIARKRRRADGPTSSTLLRGAIATRQRRWTGGPSPSTLLEGGNRYRAALGGCSVAFSPP